MKYNNHPTSGNKIFAARSKNAILPLGSDNIIVNIGQSFGELS